MKDIYVIVADNDKPVVFHGREYRDRGGPLIFEQYVNSADLESIKTRAKELSIKYGNCRIAKLKFIEEKK